MEFFANLTSSQVDVADWARAREQEGWDGLSVSDHLWIGQNAFPHLWVALAEVAITTDKPKVMSAFANNLLRSPVEFAQASLSVQRAAYGRFQAGLGAGWSSGEILNTGQDYPSPPARARRYREALIIVRRLFAERCVHYEGEFYNVHVPTLGPQTKPPALVGSVGGPWLARHVTPLVDRVELKPSGRLTRRGENRHELLAEVKEHHLQELVSIVRDVDAEVPVGMYVMAGVGDHPRVAEMRAATRGGLFERFFGHPEAVGEALLRLRSLGVEVIQVAEYAPGTHELLAPYLRQVTGG
jgi:alkanesulfonate monooxygenase SsuD/methylene tetrahydromethanopterin reductase-like flavin-dependent oxidoreductase (luciferase family)